MARAYYITTMGEWYKHLHNCAASHWMHLDPEAPVTEASEILVKVEGDEGVHLRLERADGVTTLPHPFDARPLPDHIVTKLSKHGITTGDNVLQMSYKLGGIHPSMHMRGI
jgi:hypothetical protein